MPRSFVDTRTLEFELKATTKSGLDVLETILDKDLSAIEAAFGGKSWEGMSIKATEEARGE